MERKDLIGKRIKGFLFDVTDFDWLIPYETQKKLEGKIGTIVQYDNRDDSVEVDFGNENIEWYPASKAIDHLIEESTPIFKLGDKVYHVEHGWGTVSENKSPSLLICVEFNLHTMYFTKDGRAHEDYLSPMLSFTKYTLTGFSQERPVVLPEVGELCLVRDRNEQSWKVKEFSSYNNGLFYTKELDFNPAPYRQMKRIKILD